MDFVLISDVDAILPYIPSLKESKIMVVDTETTGLDPHIHRIRLIQLAVSGLPVIIIDCFTFLPHGIELLKELLEAANVKVFQNAKFDLQFFMAMGIYPSPIFDTMLAGQMLHTSGGPNRVSLATLAQHYLSEEISKDEQKSNWQGTLNDSQLIYAARDANVLLQLREAMVNTTTNNTTPKRVSWSETKTPYGSS